MEEEPLIDSIPYNDVEFDDDNFPKISYLKLSFSFTFATLITFILIKIMILQQSFYFLLGTDGGKISGVELNISTNAYSQIIRNSKCSDFFDCIFKICKINDKLTNISNSHMVTYYPKGLFDCDVNFLEIIKKMLTSNNLQIGSIVLALSSFILNIIVLIVLHHVTGIKKQTFLKYFYLVIKLGISLSYILNKISSDHGQTSRAYPMTYTIFLEEIEIGLVILIYLVDTLIHLNMFKEIDKYPNIIPIAGSTVDKIMAYIKLFFSLTLIITTVSIIISQIILQKTYSLMMNPTGGQIYGLQWNNSLNGYLPVEQSFCQGLYGCSNNICRTWKKSPTIIGYMPNSQYMCTISVMTVVTSLFVNNNQLYYAVLVLLLLSFSLSICFVIAYHLTIGKIKNIFKWLYLVTKIGIILAYVLNMIEIAISNNEEQNYPPIYNTILEWVEMTIIILAFVIETIFYYL